MKAHRSQTEGLFIRMEEKLKNNDPEVMDWITKEVYWTYKFEN